VFVWENLAFPKPESNFFLGIFNAIGTVADVAADVNSEVSADSTGGRGKWISSAENGSPSLDGITALPHHSDDRSAQHIGNETREERLFREIGIVLLEMLLGRRDELDGSKLVAALFKAADDGTN
jgi:hypothetical protein